MITAMLRLAVIAHPGARAERLEQLTDGTLGVWVRQRPVDGQANAAVERAIASALGLRPRQVRLAAGASARRKIVEIDLPDYATLEMRLQAHAVQARPRLKSEI